MPLPQAIVSNSMTENTSNQEESAKIRRGFEELKYFCMLLGGLAFQSG
jgi:hypothetical protein